MQRNCCLRFQREAADMLCWLRQQQAAAALQASAVGVMIQQIFSSKEGRGPYDKIVPKDNVNMVLIKKSEKNWLNTLLIA